MRWGGRKASVTFGVFFSLLVNGSPRVFSFCLYDGGDCVLDGLSGVRVVLCLTPAPPVKMAT